MMRLMVAMVAVAAAVEYLRPGTLVEWLDPHLSKAGDRLDGLADEVALKWPVGA